MTNYVGLYYPFIHFRDEAWLKLTSLYWDRMGRIVPADYALRDSDTVRELRAGGYVVDYDPGSAQTGLAHAFLARLATHGEGLAERYGLHLSSTWPDDPSTLHSRAAHFGDSRLAYVYAPKIAPELIEALEALASPSAEDAAIHTGSACIRTGGPICDCPGRCHGRTAQRAADQR